MAVLRSPLKQKMYDKKFILEDHAEKKFYWPIAKALQDDLDNFPIYIRGHSIERWTQQVNSPRYSKNAWNQ